MAYGIKSHVNCEHFNHLVYPLTDIDLGMDWNGTIYYVLILFIISNALDYRWDAKIPKTNLTM